MEEHPLVELYNRLLPHHSLIDGAPALTLIEPSENDEETIRLELNQNACYLLGLPSNTSDLEKMLNSLEKNYKDDDFWRSFLLDYITFLYEEKKAAVSKETQETRERLMQSLQEILALKQAKNDTIRTFSEKVEAKRYPVDARKLFRNYLSYADKNPKEAWEMVTKNPAFFSPIKARDPKTGKMFFSPDKAREINKKLGSFIKGLKI